MGNSSSNLCRITKVVEFDAGHRVPGHKSKCCHPHGHRYRLEVTIEGPVQDVSGAEDDGMVIDFGAVKQIVKRVTHDVWDHAFLVWDGDQPMLDALSTLYRAEGVRYMESGNGIVDEPRVESLPFVPTAENLAREAFSRVSSALRDVYGEMTRVAVVRLYETPNSWADYPVPRV